MKKRILIGLAALVVLFIALVIVGIIIAPPPAPKAPEAAAAIAPPNDPPATKTVEAESPPNDPPATKTVEAESPPNDPPIATAKHGFANPDADALMARGLDATQGISNVECIFLDGYELRTGMECYGSFAGQEIVWTFRPYQRDWMDITVLGPGSEKTYRMTCVLDLQCY